MATSVLVWTSAQAKKRLQNYIPRIPTEKYNSVYARTSYFPLEKNSISIHKYKGKNHNYDPESQCGQLFLKDDNNEDISSYSSNIISHKSVLHVSALRLANRKAPRSLIVAPRLGGHEKRMELGSEIKLRRENPVVKTEYLPFLFLPKAKFKWIWFLSKLQFQMVQNLIKNAKFLSLLRGCFWGRERVRCGQTEGEGRTERLYQMTPDGAVSSKMQYRNRVT